MYIEVQPNSGDPADPLPTDPLPLPSSFMPVCRICATPVKIIHKNGKQGNTRTQELEREVDTKLTWPL